MTRWRSIANPTSLNAAVSTETAGPERDMGRQAGMTGRIDDGVADDPGFIVEIKILHLADCSVGGADPAASVRRPPPGASHHRSEIPPFHTGRKLTHPIAGSPIVHSVTIAARFNRGAA